MREKEEIITPEVIELMDMINLYAVEHEHTEGLQLETHTWLNGEGIRLEDQLTGSTLAIITSPAESLPVILKAMQEGMDIGSAVDGAEAAYRYAQFLKQMQEISDRSLRRKIEAADPTDEPLDKGFPDGSCGGMGCMAADCCDCNPCQQCGRYGICEHDNRYEEPLDKGKQ